MRTGKQVGEGLRAGFIIGLLSVWFALPTGGAQSGTNEWTPTGPPGGVILSLALDASNPLVLYAGTFGGVFKTTDMGQTWTPINTGLTYLSVQTLALDASNPLVLYAGTDGGVFKTTDMGQTWTPINTGLTNLPVSSLVLDASNPLVLYAGTTFGGGVFKTTDMGQSWTPINTGLTNLDVRSLVIKPTTPPIVFAGTNGSSVFVFEDIPAAIPTLP